MATNAALTSEINSLIAALDGTQTLEYLVTLNISAIKLGVDNSDILTRLDAISISGATLDYLTTNIIGNTLKPSGFIAGACNFGNISSGASGNILSISGVAGKRIKLTKLTCASSTESNISVTFGSREIVSASLLGNEATTAVTGTFQIGNANASVAESFIGYPGEGVVINKSTGSTAVNIGYAYVVEA